MPTIDRPCTDARGRPHVRPASTRIAHRSTHNRTRTGPCLPRASIERQRTSLDSWHPGRAAMWSCGALVVTKPKAGIATTRLACARPALSQYSASNRPVAGKDDANKSIVERHHRANARLTSVNTKALASEKSTMPAPTWHRTTPRGRSWRKGLAPTSVRAPKSVRKDSAVWQGREEAAHQHRPRQRRMAHNNAPRRTTTRTLPTTFEYDAEYVLPNRHYTPRWSARLS